MKQSSAEAYLTDELNKLKTLVGKDTEGFIKQHDFLLEHFNTEKEQKMIRDFVEKAMKESVRKIDDFVEEAKVKVNGKSARFTAHEIETLDFAIQRI
jgi:hypothetical protein